MQIHLARSVTLNFCTLLAAFPAFSREGLRKADNVTVLVRDSDAPNVTLIVSRQPTRSSLSIEVDARDPSGIAGVSVSFAGAIVATRVRAPFHFELQADDLPVEVCAIAVDPAGHSAMDCERVGATGACTSNAQCQEELYCEKAFGDCSDTGVCSIRPENCSFSQAPVCGCDGTTYAGECAAAFKGVNVHHHGVCREDICTRNDDCRAGNYCRKVDGYCESRGFCTERIAFNCPPLGVSPDFVCGCDGRTYERCHAYDADVNIAHDSPCDKD